MFSFFRKKEKIGNQLPNYLGKVLPRSLGGYSCEPLGKQGNEGWICLDEHGICLVRNQSLEESVPWVALNHLSFIGKRRELTISFSNPQAQPVTLRLQSSNPQKFMEAAKGYLEASIVLVRQRRLESGLLLQGSVRRDETGEFLLLITALNDKPVNQVEVDDFELELRQVIEK
ncbi:hypothetical protein KRX54_05555 [Actinomycetaceae bacterium TAE3-ERU4]|nr:hypothetical protein [Actinomycetaceae bacterium TAE3-ERU4]